MGGGWGACRPPRHTGDTLTKKHNTLMTSITQKHTSPSHHITSRFPDTEELQLYLLTSFSPGRDTKNHKHQCEKIIMKTKIMETAEKASNKIKAITYLFQSNAPKHLRLTK